MSKSIKALLFDLDGTLLQGDVLLPGVDSLFKYLDQSDFPYFIATNNATKTAVDYQEKLKALGVRVDEDRILTSAIATADYLDGELPADRTIYIIGEPALRSALLLKGFSIIKDATQPVSAVVVGGDSNLTYDKLKFSALHIQRGAGFFGTNPDVVYPTDEGLVPETGTTLAALEAATGVHPTIIGKPSRYMYTIALNRLGFKPSEVAIVGDRLDTDILGGQNAGLITILTTTGVDNAGTIAAKGIDPDFVIHNLSELISLLSKE